MSIEENETLKKLIGVQKETLEIVKKVLDAMNNIKDEIADQLADSNKEQLEKIHVVDTFCRNILEANQHTLYKKVLELSGEEIERKEASETT